MSSGEEIYFLKMRRRQVRVDQTLPNVWVGNCSDKQKQCSINILGRERSFAINFKLVVIESSVAWRMNTVILSFIFVAIVPSKLTKCKCQINANSVNRANEGEIAMTIVSNCSNSDSNDELKTTVVLGETVRDSSRIFYTSRTQQFGNKEMILCKAEQV